MVAEVVVTALKATALMVGIVAVVKKVKLADMPVPLELEDKTT